MTEREETIKNLRRMLEDDIRTENNRHKLAKTYLEHSLDELRKQCPHPEEYNFRNYGVFPEDTWMQCTLCGAAL